MRELEPQRRARPGLDRLAKQLHRGFARRAPPLADVALQAGADDVLPGRTSPLAARNHVIEAKLAGGELAATVLTAIAVTREDIAAIELHLLLGQPVISQKPDDPRYLDLEVDGTDEFVVRASKGRPGQRCFAPGREIERDILAVINRDDFRDLLEQEAEGPSDRNDVN